jgi:hypothetical protein
MMKVGMLWFDDSCETGLVERIEQASDYYHSKYGHKPNLCFVHPDSLVGAEASSGFALKIKASHTLLENHFWIGVEETDK